MTEFYFWTCEHSIAKIIDGYLLLLYKFAMHAAALFLIFSIRKIKLSALNDYKANSAIVYVQTAIFVILVVGLALLTDYPTFYALLCANMIFIASTTFLGLTFIPKVISACIGTYHFILNVSLSWSF